MILHEKLAIGGHTRGRSERRSVGGTDFLQGPAGAAPLLPSELARFCWSVEYAHEDAVLALVCARDPACVLTSGLDRCVRMWSHTGSFKASYPRLHARHAVALLVSGGRCRRARNEDDAEAKRVAADLMGDSDSSQTPIVVSKIEEARALDEQIQEPELSPRLAAVRGALSEIQAMGTVDVDDPYLVAAGVAGVVEESTDAEGVRVYFCLNWTLRGVEHARLEADDGRVARLRRFETEVEFRLDHGEPEEAAARGAVGAGRTGLCAHLWLAMVCEPSLNREGLRVHHVA